MNHREYPIMPTQQAINGALDIYVEGRKRDCVPQMLAGFSVLRYATEEQVHTAMPFVQALIRRRQFNVRPNCPQIRPGKPHPKRGLGWPNPPP